MKALVVDGYNAVHKIPALIKVMDKSLVEARREITILARAYQRRVGGIDRVSVVFDGQDRYRGGHFNNPPHQIFSGTGEGDREIIRTVRKLSGKYHVVVVTDDNYVRNNARAHNASVISVKQFIAALNQRPPKDASEHPSKTIPSETAAEIDAELRKRWGLE